MHTLPMPEERDLRTTVTRVRTQHDARLIGLPLERVRLSWTVRTDSPDARQVGYQIRTRAGVAGEWRVHEPVASDRAVDVAVAESLPAERETRDYEVRIATQAGWTDWSETVRLETGVRGGSLEGVVIDIPSSIEGPVPVLRREFTVDELPERALLRISALGVYDVSINGVQVTDGILNPGWTAYQERILLDTVEVTSALQLGINAIAIRVTDGWFRGRMGFAGRTEIYGPRIGAIAQLEVVRDGETAIVVATDAEWKGGFGVVRAASIYDGSTIDFTLAAGDPSTVGFDDSEWQHTATVPVDPSVFEPRAVPPVREVATFPMTRTAHGSAVRLDAGQNISGWVRLVVRGRRGDTITVRHAEVLEPDGALHTAALRTAKATDEYVLGEDGTAELEPAFTFHGFRYAEVVGAEAVIEATAVAISTDIPARSSFSSAHPALDRFHENVRWSQLDNFVSLPTDCPQRDERLGWTGDAQAFAPTSATLFDTEAFWRSWLRDLEIEQSDELGVPSIVPNILVWGDMQAAEVPTETMGRAGWADAANIVPLAVYDAYGSTEVLENQLSSMQRWVDHLRRRAGDDVLLPEEPFQYGDWLDPDAPGHEPWKAKVDSLFVANAFYVHSVRLLARAERVLGLTHAAAEHEDLARVIADAVWERWGAEAETTQTGAAMSLEFGIVPPDLRTALAQQLAEHVRAESGRIATGFLGTPLVLDALSRNGHLAEAYLMLLRRDAPSWLYQVDRGATTVWERWDAIKPDGTIHGGEMGSKEGDSMLSFNHYAYGAMVDWVYRNVAGLAPERPGYRIARIAPRPADQLLHAKAVIDTPYGKLGIDWHVDDETLVAFLTVPFGIEAQLDLPTTANSQITVDGSPATGTTLTHGMHRIEVSHAAMVSVDASVASVASVAAGE